MNSSDSQDDDARPDQLDPEHNLIGALLHMPRNDLVPLLELVHDTDVADWRARAVLELIRQNTAAGQPADPVAVSAAARTSTRNGEAARKLDHYILDVYRNVVTPSNVRYYAHRVTEDAYRREFEAAGIRLQQMAAAYVDIEDLEQFTGELVHRWRETRQRVRALTTQRSPAAPRSNNP